MNMGWPLSAKKFNETALMLDKKKGDDSLVTIIDGKVRVLSIAMPLVPFADVSWEEFSDHYHYFKNITERV